MQETDPLAYPLRWDLPGQTQHPFVTGISGTQGRRGIQDTRSGDHAVNTHPARGTGIAVCHVGHTLFMAGIENPESVAFVINGIEQVVGLSSRQAEDSIDTVPAYRFDERFGAGHRAHGVSPLVFCSIVPVNRKQR